MAIDFSPSTFTATSIDARPTTLTAVHNYNLRNQGWPSIFPCIFKFDTDDGAIDRDPVLHTKNHVGVYPSNSDVIYSAKVTQALKPDGIGAYSPWQLLKQNFGNTPAAKGHYILPAFNRDRQLVSGIQGIYNEARDKETDRPISVAFYAGRVWYLMPNGKIYYSQVLTEFSNVNKCYQDADPTAEDINELVATDGGELDITGISRGIKLVQVDYQLIVFAENGIWSITGDSDGKSFTATAQTIRKITEVGTVGPETMVLAEGNVFFWSEGGIYTLQSDEVTGQLAAVNLAEDTILTLYFSIPVVAKKFARGFYDEASKKITWLYNDTPEYDGINFKYKYNRQLVLDLTLKAFYTYSIDLEDGFPFVIGIVKKQSGTRNTFLQNITDNDGTPITDNDDAVLTSSVEITSRGDQRIKFVCFRKFGPEYKYAFAEMRYDTMYDWQSVDGVGLDYFSYVDTGSNIIEDLLSEKEANIVHFFFKRTEEEFIEDNGAIVLDKPSSCWFRLKWDWSNSNTSGRWTSLEQIYRFRREYFPLPVGPSQFTYGQDVIETIEQVRGKGRSLTLHFESESGKDFHLLGWAMPATLTTGF